MLRHCHILVGLPFLALPSALFAQATAPAAPATPPVEAPSAPVQAEADEEDIVITGQKPRGSVTGDIPAEQTLNPADIRSYGVNNVSDLLDQLAPQTGSARGRGGEQPVVLLNGRRISGFSEIRDLPTEAISRVEILPEEVSLKYGYPADQKVVNFVLRERFLAVLGQARASTSTEGGGTGADPEANYIRIRGDQRFTVNLRYQDTGRLRESQRDVADVGSSRPYSLTGNIAAPPGASSTEIDPALSALAGQTVTVAALPIDTGTGQVPLSTFVAGANQPSTTDITRYKTLRGASQQVSGNAVYALPVFARSTLTLNGSMAYQTGDSLRGLPAASLTVPTGDPFSPFANPVGVYRYVGTDPLHQRTSSVTGHAGASVNGDKGRWRWSATSNFDHAESRTRTQTGYDTSAFQARLNALDVGANPFGQLTRADFGTLQTDRARSVTNTGNVQALAGGPVLKLPAGDITTNIKVGYEYTGFDATSLRRGIEQSSDLHRGNANGQVNVDLPIASRRTGVLQPLGNLSLNANLAVRRLSDFGTLTTWGGGLVWSPIAPVSLIGSYTRDEGAPTLNQLGDPVVVTPQVRVFDYVRGQTVDVTQTSGGNPALRADNRRVWKAGVTLKPFQDKNDLTIIANYVRTRTRNAIASLPEPTAELEAAFPDRFVRDANGTLVSVDARPVNFERQRQDQIRYGFNVSINLKSIMQKRFESWVEARKAGQNPPSPVSPNNYRPILAENRADFARRQEEFRKREQERQAESGQAPGGPTQAQTGSGSQPQSAQPSTSPATDAPPSPPPAEGGAQSPGGGLGGAPGGGEFGGPGGRGGFGGFRGGRGGQGQSGRLQVAIYDTWTLRDDVLIRQGVPLLDLLDGASVGSGGGTSRHQVQLQLGYANNGLGLRAEGNWRSPTIVRGDAGTTGGVTGTSEDLRFSGLTTFNLRAFADMGAIPTFTGKQWARGLRISVGVNNLFNSRQRVRDSAGDTPVRYQPAFLDPLGRTVSISVRKLIF